MPGIVSKDEFKRDVHTMMLHNPEMSEEQAKAMVIAGGTRCADDAEAESTVALGAKIPKFE